MKGGLAAGGLALGGLADLPASRAAEVPQCAIPDPPQTGTEPRAPSYSFPSPAVMRVRKSFADLTPDEIKDLAKAYGQLKAEQGSLSWCDQANIHANHCVAASYYLLIHDSWLFLPWHRCYLYFYESRLGELLGKPSFALPYWDWTNSPTIPDAFFDSASPLYDPNRGPAKGQSIASDPETYQYTRQDFINNQLLANPDFNSFGGYPGDQSSNQPGDLEQFPHNYVHTWVGTQTSPYIDMGNLATAARDLLFFLHHANIDRIWANWMQVPGHHNPPDAAWFQQWFNFFDPKMGNAVSVTINDCINGNMSVRYQEPQTVIALHSGEENLTGRTFTSRKAALSGPAVARVLHPTVAAAAVSPPGMRLRVRIEGVRSDRQQPLRLRVFLNKPNATAETPLTDPHFAGSIPLVPSFRPRAAHGHEHPPVTLSLDVSHKVAELLRENPDNANLEVTLVPTTLDNKLSRAKITFKGISIKMAK
jgi:polyphenol oxidase